MIGCDPNYAPGHAADVGPGSRDHSLGLRRRLACRHRRFARRGSARVGARDVVSARHAPRHRAVARRSLGWSSAGGQHGSVAVFAPASGNAPPGRLARSARPPQGIGADLLLPRPTAVVVLARDAPAGSRRARLPGRPVRSLGGVPALGRRLFRRWRGHLDTVLHRTGRVSTRGESPTFRARRWPSS